MDLFDLDVGGVVAGDRDGLIREERFLDSDADLPGPGSQLNSTKTDAHISNPSSGATGAAKKAKRIYKPRTGAARERNKDAQRRYRERVKEKALETEAAVEKINAQLAAAREEQERLRAENTALEMIRHYADSAIAALRSAAASISSAVSDAKSSAQTRSAKIYADAMEAFWYHLRSPSEEQLRVIAREEKNLHPLNSTFIALLCTFVHEWFTGSPNTRVLPERKLSILFNSRHRFANILFEVDPKKALRLIQAFSPEYPQLRRQETPAERRARVACICNPEVIAASRVTDEQKVALLQHWNLYKQRYKTAKTAVGESARQIEESIASAAQGAANSEPIGSLHAAAKAYVSISEATELLSDYNTEELIARMELMTGVFAVLTPIQHAYVLLTAVPEPDIVGIYKSMLQLQD